SRNAFMTGYYPYHTGLQFVDHAINVISTHNPDEPLFLYLPFHLVHVPHEVPQRFEICTAPYKMTTEECTANGGPTFDGANNLPLRGAKTTLWEGGTRGAGFVHSKTLLKKTGYVNNGMMHAVDWFPTILHLAQIQPDSKIDGVNQWDMLSAGAPSNRMEFVYNIDNITQAAAIRSQCLPLPFLLFCDVDDPEERQDLSAQMPDMMSFLQRRLAEYRQSEVPPQNAPVDPAGDPKNFGGVWTPGWC
ncbi:hypothetical protein BaRGS_00032106, partial [Batillaria attramentaria]